MLKYVCVLQDVHVQVQVAHKIPEDIDDNLFVGSITIPCQSIKCCVDHVYVVAVYEEIHKQFHLTLLLLTICL
jgi:hypothetical protein